MAKNKMFSITEAANYCAIGRVTDHHKSLMKFILRSFHIVEHPNMLG